MYFSTNSMYDPIAMAEFKSTKRHGHPALNISWVKNIGTILDDRLEVAVKKLKDKVEISLGGIHIQELSTRYI
jgi:hypothetical protein